MKYLIVAVLFLFPRIAHAVNDTRTPNMNLIKIATGTINWGLKANANYDVIDSSVVLAGSTVTWISSHTFKSAVQITSSVWINGGGFIGSVLVGTTTNIHGGTEYLVDANPSLVLGVAGGSNYGFIQYLDSGPLLRIFDGTNYSISSKIGNVGIGNTNPVRQLVVSSDTSNGTIIGSNEVIRVAGGNGSVNTTSEIGLTYGDGNADVHSPATIGYQLKSVSGFTKGDLYFATRNATTDSSPTERMRILASGDVAIGTSATNLAGGGQGTFFTCSGSGAAASQSCRIELNNPKVTAVGDLAGEINFESSSNLGDIRMAQAYSEPIGSGGSNGYGGIFKLTTKKDNSTSFNAGLSVDQSGQVGIGNFAPGSALDVTGTIRQSAVTSCANGLTTDSNGGITGCAAGGGGAASSYAILYASADFNNVVASTIPILSLALQSSTTFHVTAQFQITGTPSLGFIYIDSDTASGDYTVQQPFNRAASYGTNVTAPCQFSPSRGAIASGQLFDISFDIKPKRGINSNIILTNFTGWTDIDGSQYTNFFGGTCVLTAASKDAGGTPLLTSVALSLGATSGTLSGHWELWQGNTSK